MTFEIHPEVLETDLPVIGDFIARNNVVAARAVLAAIDATFDQLRRQPFSGVEWKTGNRRLAGMRMSPAQVYPTYLIFYRGDADFVRILYVVHSARELAKFFAKNVRN